MQSTSSSCPPAESNARLSSESITTTSAHHGPLCSQPEPLSPRTSSAVLPQVDKPLIRHDSANDVHQEASLDPVPNPSFDSDHGLTTLAFPSTTWSSCPSPRRTTSCSGSGPNLTPSAPVTRLESQHWPVLPPISPVRGEK